MWAITTGCLTYSWPWHAAGTSPEEPVGFLLSSFSPSLPPFFLPPFPLPPLHCLSFLFFSLSPLGPFVVTQLLSHVWLCNLSDCCTPGFPVLHYLPEFAQVHVHWISDAIQPSHPLPSSSSFAFNLSPASDLFQSVGSSHQVAKVLELQLQQQSFQWIFRVDVL